MRALIAAAVLAALGASGAAEARQDRHTACYAFAYTPSNEVNFIHTGVFAEGSYWEAMSARFRTYLENRWSADRFPKYGCVPPGDRADVQAALDEEIARFQRGSVGPSYSKGVPIFVNWTDPGWR